MKKILLSLFTLSICFLGINAASAITYKDALDSNKPSAILVYADWADDVNKVKQKFSIIENDYSDKYNFVLMNIASAETKLFNEKYHIYPNLPYVLLFKNNGKISRYLQKDCIVDDGCFTEKLKFFNN